MIKGDVQIPEPAMVLPPLPLRKDLDTNFSTEETRIETSIIEKSADKIEVELHFARLKRRMRSRSSSIL